MRVNDRVPSCIIEGTNSSRPYGLFNNFVLFQIFDPSMKKKKKKKKTTFDLDSALAGTAPTDETVTTGIVSVVVV